MDADDRHANRDGLAATETSRDAAAPSAGCRIAAVDLFCGIGGLSYGLASAGVEVVAGIDVDGSCKFPFEANMDGSQFIRRDICEVTADELSGLWPEGATRLLAGCAPCQPFSSYRKGVSSSNDDRW